MVPQFRWVVCAALAVFGGCSAPVARPTPCEAQSGGCGPGQDAGAAPACEMDEQCPTSLPRCLAGQGRCVQCLEDADCARGLCDGPSGACLAQPDTCQTASPLDLSGGQATVRGNTVGAQDDVTASCAISGSRAGDLVYTFTLAERRRVVAVVRPDPGSALKPVVVLRSGCEAVEPSFNRGCSYVPPGADEAEVSSELEPGTYWLWVDADGESSGGFSLTVSAESPAPGDTCGSPTLLAAGSLLEVQGDTRSARNDAAGSCGGAGPDLVYELRLTQPARVGVQLSELSPGFRPVVYLRRAPCASAQLASQLGCVNEVEKSGRTRPLEVPRLEAGSYFLFVDGDLGPDLNPTQGAYKLSVTLGPPLGTAPNDACPGATALQLPASGYGSTQVTGDTAFAVNDSAGCGGSGPDVVYALRVPAPRHLIARVSPTTGSGLLPVLYLRKPSACDSELAQDQLACNVAVAPGSPASLDVPNLAAGQYFLWVDGAGGSQGAFNLNVELLAVSPAPPNDSCSSPQPLFPGTGPVTLPGTTTGAAIDTALSCQLPPVSPDVVYEIAVPNRQSLALDLQALSGSSLLPVLALRRPGACSSLSLADAVGCSWGDPQLPDRTVLNVPALDPGSYFLWVAGDSGSHGEFNLRVALGPEVPAAANDDCQDPPLVLARGNTATGDTRNASNAAAGRCSGASGADANDVLYHFSLTTPSPVTLTVAPDPSAGKLLRPLIYVRGPGAVACGSSLAGDQRGCAVASAYGAQVSLTLPSLPTGTYSVWVDGAGHSSGKFTIKFQ